MPTTYSVTAGLPSTIALSGNTLAGDTSANAPAYTLTLSVPGSGSALILNGTTLGLALTDSNADARVITVAGTFVGWALIRTIDRLSEAGIGVSLPVGQLLLILVAGVVLGLLAALIPARRSTRLEVLDAIKAT